MEKADRAGEPKTDPVELYRLVCDLHASLSDPDIYQALLACAQEMNRRLSATPTRNGWDEALANARSGTVNLRIICEEVVAQAGAQ